MTAVPLLECVPNFSESRNFAVIEAIRRSIQAIDEVKVINIHADSDHNRSVFTFIGNSEPIQEAAFQAVRTAAGLIDLNRHTGCHPRIGATDVIPFVPLKNASMTDAIAASVSLAERLGRELSIPVYLYGKASRIPEHRGLAFLRRGGYETLQHRIQTEEAMQPDFGPNQVGAVGATAVGARDFLIAFNILLETPDIAIAKKIAREIRESSGGLPGVQALGMEVNHLAQVSMNLTDYRKTSLLQLYRAVESAAGKMNVGIAHSELIGCLPATAIENIDLSQLNLVEFSEDRILESHFS